MAEDGLSMAELLAETTRRHASDLVLVAGAPPIYRVYGKMTPSKQPPLDAVALQSLIRPLLTDAQWKQIQQVGDVDFAIEVPNLGRFRANVHLQKGSMAACIRSLATTPPKFEELMLPEQLLKLVDLKSGLVLITGVTGSGKTSTLASLIEIINQKHSYHIITLEDPIEFVFQHGRSIIEQREIGQDAPSFHSALKYALRQAPDVMLIGEMRDLETIQAAVTMAETGHLVFGTLHTISASQTVERIIDVFPASQQASIRFQFANVIQAIICQFLLPRKDGKGRVPGVELLLGSLAVRNCIRNEEHHRLPGILEGSRQQGMIPLKLSLQYWVQSGVVDPADIEPLQRSRQMV